MPLVSASCAAKSTGQEARFRTGKAVAPWRGRLHVSMHARQSRSRPSRLVERPAPKGFVFELRCSETENDSLRWSLGPFKTPQRVFGALAHTVGASQRLASEKTQMSANQRHPFENTGREIVERFGKDNCRIRSICVRSG